MRKLTVIIPCKNERPNIRACIESARLIADEVLIADSGSTDGTLDVVRQMGGCRVIEREYVHAGDFKNWAIPQATHDWVFILDADERITPELAAEVRQHLAEGPKRDGYLVPRLNYFMGYPVRRSGWGNEALMRFFLRDHGRYVGDTDHAEVAIATGRSGRLRSRMEHFTFWTYDQYLQKTHRYARWQASVWFEQGRPPSLFKLFFNAPLRFFRCYVLQRGFLDGLVGFQVSMLQGYYTFLKQARLWELWHARPQPEADLTVYEPRPRARGPQPESTRPVRTPAA
jgi:glycosyltransferase involved in cell wall biosynthesis